jgi:hypothetical protein
MGCFWMWGLLHWTGFMPNVLKGGIDMCTGLHTVDDKEIPCERFWVILCASTFWVSHLFTRAHDGSMMKCTMEKIRCWLLKLNEISGCKLCEGGISTDI